MKPFTNVLHLKLLDPAWEPRGERFYCCVCIDSHDSGDGFWSEKAAEGHLSAYHDIEQDEVELGVHYCLGTHLKVKLRRWRQSNDQEATRFGRILEAMTPEDFLFDTGRGA